MFFRNVTDQALDKIHNRESLFHIGIVFVAVIMECNRIAVIAVNSGGGDNGPSKIAPDVFGDYFGITEIGLGIDVETVFVLAVAFRFHLFERRTNLVFQPIEKGSTESITEKVVVKMFYMTPETIIAETAFREEAVDVGIPFEVPAEGMEDHDIAGSVIFGMIEIEKHP